MIGGLRRRSLHGPAATGAPQGWPAGHFYSPVVSNEDIDRHRARAYQACGDRDLPGIDLDLEAQLELFARIGKVATRQPWSDEPAGAWRYGFDNPYFGPGESLVLLGMLAEVSPSRIVEVGAGWSTAAILDVNDLLFAGRVPLTTIEPYPSALTARLRAGDNVKVIERAVQEVGLEPFLALEAGDILFIDSSHVVKFGSDVHFLLGEVLPRLAPGVYVHFHDVMHPFEYPLEWIRQGRNWNEAYFLRSFLAFNSAFTIELFASYVWAVAPDRAARLLPAAAASPGSSLWLLRR
jgi:hypothetical protein